MGREFVGGVIGEELRGLRSIQTSKVAIISPLGSVDGRGRDVVSQPVGDSCVQVSLVSYKCVLR